MNSAPTFSDFYQAINGRPPFPWQARLAEGVAETGEWPAEVGVPTGMGKTACLDIAVWYLASQAYREPGQRAAPTRVWWVVNRRLLVDSTAEHAERMATILAQPSASGLSGRDREVVSAVAERLRSLSADPNAPPLDVIRLRGGVASRTPVDPSSPTILLCTLPMYGSRLLFRGYGSTLRQIDAAMAGTDSLVLLDEAHLAPHLRALIPALAECMPGAELLLGESRSRPRISALTATGDPSGGRFDLDKEDEANPVIRQRLHAAKPLELRKAREANNPAKHLADAAIELLQQAQKPSACLVFANTPATARETLENLRGRLRDDEAETLLLTGLSREREAERIRARILDSEDGMAATRSPGLVRQRHLIVVATQTLEVGADVDAEYLVTEACGVRALTQRLGRLNRLGHHPHARAVYVHLPAPQQRRGTAAEGSVNESWPVYWHEPAQVLERLESACTHVDDCVVDLSPVRVAEVLGPPGDELGRAPEVLPGILWEWTKTTTPPEGEAPVEPYFSGIAGAQYMVSLIWRVHVPEEGERLWPRASDREAVDVPLIEARDALKDDQDLRRLAFDGATVESTHAGDLRPGDQVVLPADSGLLDSFGWNPRASECVVDASLTGNGLPLDEKAIERLCGVNMGEQLRIALGGDGDEDIEQADREEAVEVLLARLRSVASPHGWGAEEWAGFIGALSSNIEQARGEVARLRITEPQVQLPSSDFSGEFDELSLGAVTIRLDEHGQAVGARARSIAERIGLPVHLIDVVGHAGALHDVGKADVRFQRWLDPEGQHSGTIAKSNMPRHRWEAARAASAWPRGGRHEDLSARLTHARLARGADWIASDERDLLLHLIISHHGKGRPLVPPALDGSAGVVVHEIVGMAVQAPADLAAVDWDQPRRFRKLNERFGPWGLALLEAAVIRADHAVSAGASLTQERL